MATPKKPKPEPPAPAPPKKPARKRNAIFLTLDDETDARLRAFIARQRIRPDRATVAYTALVELLDRDEHERR